MTARTLPAMSEAQLQSAVIELAKVRGWKVTHFRAAKIRDDRWAVPLQGDPGFVDIVLARAGRVLFVELKSERGKVTLDQQAWLEELDYFGTVWRPAHWRSGEIERVLR